MPDKKIIIATVHNWNDALKTGNHHYAEMFTHEGFEICWLSLPASPLNTLKILEKRHQMLLIDSLKRMQKEEHVYYCKPFTFLPYSNKFFFDKEWIGKNILKFTFPPVKRILSHNGFMNVDILWISDFLSAYYLAKIVQYKKLVLRIADDNTAFKNSPKSILNIQQELIQKADYVFVTAKKLMKYQRPDQHNFFYLPNGVDVNHFKKECKMPIEYQKIPSPRILYVGVIYDWFDKNLLKYVASCLSSFNFILIGPSNINLSDIKIFKNIHIFGPKSYDSIPAYMQHSDVGIIPFKVNQLTHSVSPLKMFEYFAAGLPVVSTDFSEIQQMNSPAKLAQNSTEFLQATREAYQEKESQNQEFLEFAEKNSWDERFKIIKEKVLTKL